MDRPRQRPEGALIEKALRNSGLSIRQAADAAGLSEGRWRQITAGYQSLGSGQYRAVVGPAKRIARMAQVVGLSPQQLERAGRADAAKELRRLPPMGTPPQVPADLPTGDLATRLDWIRKQGREQGWPTEQTRRIADWLIDLDRQAHQGRRAAG